MRILKSTLDRMIPDIVTNSKLKEDFIGYLISDKPCILDCIWHNNKETLPDVRFNDIGITVYQVPVSGGTIVLQKGDLGFLHMSNDQYSRWEIAAMQEIQKFLARVYNISSDIVGNDLLIDGDKVIGSANGLINNHRIAALFVSMNSTNNMIEQVCIKPKQHKGFTGLNVDPESLIRKVVFFSKRWEDNEL